MAFHSHSSLLEKTELEDNQSDTQSEKMVLSNSTNTHSNNSSRRCPRRQESFTQAVLRRYKNVTKRKNQLTKFNPDKTQRKIDSDIPTDIQTSQQAQLKRAMYNARQTPLIPFIIDIDASLIFDSSQRQNDLLINILTLFNNIEEECSFFEQFKI